MSRTHKDRGRQWKGEPWGRRGGPFRAWIGKVGKRLMNQFERRRDKAAARAAIEKGHHTRRRG